MAKKSIPLANIKIAAPCPADWSSMNGNDRVRFCSHCQLNVYNLSAMTKNEAELLIQQTEGRLCVRYYQRADGTILTQNCPVGLQALKQRVSRIATAIASAFLSFFSSVGIYQYFYSPAKQNTPLQGQVAIVNTQDTTTPPISCNTNNGNNEEWIVGRMPLPVNTEVIMGDISTSVMQDELANIPETVIYSEKQLRDIAIIKLDPGYPALADNAEGAVSLAITVDENGDVIKAEAKTGHPLLQTTAINAATQWKFKPVIIGGVAHRVESTLTFLFVR
jgi:TonB family protein